MKKITYLFVLFIILTSCSKDNNPDTSFTNSDLEGTWKVTEIKSEKGKFLGSYTTPLGDFPINSNIEVFGKDYDMTVTFSENPKQISTQGKMKVVIKIMSLPVVGEQEYEQEITETPFGNGNWKIENNKLITEFEGKTNSVDIIAQNKTEISLSYLLNESFGDATIGSQVKDVKIEGSLVVKLNKK